MKVVKWIGNTVVTLLLIVMVALFILAATSKLSQDGVPKLGVYQMMEVLSGSMSPVFEAGDVIVIKPVPSASIQKGDIITFRDSEKSRMVITHRVTEIVNENGLVFKTKGDANDGIDQGTVAAGNVLGKYTLRIPYLGWIVEFVKTKKGMLLLVIFPGLLILITEFRKFVKTLSEKDIKVRDGEVVAKPWSGD